MVKFQGYLAGLAFALLLAAYLAMELLAAYPASQHLWHLNLTFAREARPLLQHVDALAGGSSALTILGLGGLVLLCVAAGLSNMRLLAAANCHIALVLLAFLAARSYVRTYPHGLLGDDMLSLVAKLSLVQVGMVGFLAMLAGACILSHVEILGHGFSRIRRGNAVPARRAGASGKVLQT